LSVPNRCTAAGHGFCPTVFAGHVQARKHRLATRRTDVVDDGVTLCFQNIRHNHLGAFACKQPGFDFAHATA
jgi:hypothetical protein